jgi:hypothetical protein
VDFNLLSLGKKMRGHFKIKGIILGMTPLLILANVLPNIVINTEIQINQNNTNSTLVFIPEKTIHISLYVFERTGNKKEIITVSYLEARKIYTSLLELRKEETAYSFSVKIQQLKKELSRILQQRHQQSSKIIEEINTILPYIKSKMQTQTSFFEKMKKSISTTQINITRFLCSVGSQGVGTILPPIQIPRPRLAGLWTGGDESSTSIISFLPYGGVTASGKQIGVALGFIGLGVSFAFPEAPVYMLFGYAIIIHITANSIETFP